MKRKKGFYSISAVAKMFSVHQQTIRLYEKQGLIVPKRSSGNTRLFSEEDVDKLEEIIYLTHQLSINLAGVEMILKLQKKISRLQREVNALFDDTQQELKQEQTATEHAVKTQVKEIVRVRKRKQPLELPAPETNSQQQTPETTAFDAENWEITYEE
jgi:MerR family transcriptional regulator, heat shock protein HspR